MVRGVLPFFTVVFLLCAVPVSGRADTGEMEKLRAELARLSSLVETLHATVQEQQRQIELLREERSGQPERAPTAPAVPVAASASRSPFNPEIGVVGDIVAHASERHADDEGNDKVSVRELELVVGHDVDPYSRFDATIAFSDFEDVHLEEAYLTHWGIPDVTARLGRLRPKVGMATAVHRDQLLTVDEPRVVAEYLGEEGYFRTGIELSSFLPLPWETLTHEVITGVLEGGVGHGGTVFGDTRRRPTYYTALRNFWQISDEMDATLSGTWMIGSADDDASYEVNVFGLHGRFDRYLSGVQRLRFQTEAYLQDRTEPAVEAAEHGHAHSRHADGHGDSLTGVGGDATLRENPFGLYSLLDYRFALRWSTGFRFDYVEPTNRSTSAFENEELAYTGYLTFHQSEFARWRFQYQHREEVDGRDDERFWLQGTFAIGVHKHELE